MKKVERLIEQIIRTPETVDDGRLANCLLDQFHRGAPLENLRPLLLSPHPELASSGAWIASELGEKGKPLLNVVVNLLEHPDKRVRFWIIDCVLLWAGPSKQRELSKAVRLIDDREKAVRWKAMVFLSRASRDQLEAALAWFLSEEPESPNVLGLRWLLGATGSDVEAVEAMLENTEPRMRKYAAVAAVRMALENQHSLVIAASLGDTEVAEFAADSLGSLRIGEET